MDILDIAPDAPRTPEPSPEPEAQQDTEITLGTGRLLGLFFALVVVCALFFSLGYSIGRSSGKAALNLTENGTAQLPPSTGSTVKPTGGTPAVVMPAAAQSDCAASGNCPGLSSANKPADVPAQPTTTTTSSLPGADGQSAPPELSKPTTPPGGAGYVVQVAAVSKQEDAEALVNALRRKDYPVFVASNSGDKLFHVQVGPFVELKDAESTRNKLTNDGYNPILKR